ncbi:unnamed protein product [Cylindrotheca closterium]|uniref:Uncharacterized protein n=1 Tax=Cylindrotheca closterium TaxID=2856 RepID=A0AAD2FYN0_9STRA|nr:unnamed protein product [Cylindrotheca closterium]
MVPQIRESIHYQHDEEPVWLSVFGSERKSVSKELRSDFHPPSYIIVQQKRVLFDDNLDIFCVDRVSGKYHDKVWYSEAELASFEERYIAKAGKKRSLRERDARAYNHSRRVLLHHRAYKEMGDYNKANDLEYFSSQSSQSCKDMCRKQAKRLEKEVRSIQSESDEQTTSSSTGLEYFIEKVFSFSSQGS